MGRRRKGEGAPSDAVIESRRQLAFEMRKQGAAYRTIGQALNISHEQARKDVTVILAQVNAKSQDMAVEYREMMLARLDEMLAGLYEKATSGNMLAIDRVLRIEERRAKLLGLDAPQAVDLSTPADRPFTVRVIFADDHDSE